jgi:DUF4097 and DUF4098 domain-containing protein YvlB
MSQEKLQILKMVQEGKVTADEALKLIEALESSDAGAGIPKTSAQWLRVRVTDSKTAKPKVNVNLPIGLLSVVTKFVKMEDMGGIDLNEIIRQIKEGARGKIVDVQDEDEGVHVEVVIE